MRMNICGFGHTQHSRDTTTQSKNWAQLENNMNWGSLLKYMQLTRTICTLPRNPVRIHTYKKPAAFAVFLSAKHPARSSAQTQIVYAAKSWRIWWHQHIHVNLASDLKHKRAFTFFHLPSILTTTKPEYLKMCTCAGQCRNEMGCCKSSCRLWRGHRIHRSISFLH